MKDNMNKHIISLINITSLCHYGKIETVLDYKCTFGLIEGKSTSVTHERLQVSVNSTGILFIYL
jgi:hypothetical protein